MPLCLLLIPLFPGAPVTLILGLALGLSATNGMLTWLLLASASPHRPRLVGCLSTALEWTLGLMIVFACCQDAGSSVVALGILTTLVLIAAARFRLFGLLAAEFAAGASGLGMFTLQASIVHQSPLTALGLSLARWEGMLLPIGLVVGALLETNVEAGQRGRSSLGDDRVGPVPLHLSAREWQLLPLLAQPGLSYQEIAGQFSVSVRTIRTYVHRLSKKFRVPGCREAVVAAARERRLLDLPSR